MTDGVGSVMFLQIPKQRPRLPSHKNSLLIKNLTCLQADIRKFHGEFTGVKSRDALTFYLPYKVACVIVTIRKNEMDMREK